MFPRRYLLMIVCLLIPSEQFALSQTPAEDAPKAPGPEKRGGTDLLGDPLPPGVIARLGTSRLWLSMARYRVFSPDATRLATVNDVDLRRFLRMWDVKTGTELWNIPLPGSEEMQHAIPFQIFSPDGKAVAVGCHDKTIRLWDTATGKERGRLTGHEWFVRRLAFSPDGKVLASVDTEQTIRFWDMETSKELRHVRDEYGRTDDLAFSADGKALTTMRDIVLQPYADHRVVWTASRWDAATGKLLPRQTFETPRGYNHALSPDGQLFAVVTEDWKKIRLIDPMTGKELRRTEGDGNQLNGLVFAGDGRSLAAASDDGVVLVWDVATGKLRHKFPTLSGGVWGLALSRDGGLLVLNGSAKPNCMYIYDVAKGKDIHEFSGHRSRPLTAAFARDGKTVITTDPPAFSQPVTKWDAWSFCVWDAATGKQLRATSVDPRGEVRLVLDSPDARLIATVIHDGTIRLWDVATGKEAQHWKGPTREIKWQVGKESKTADYTAVLSAAFSPDGKTFLVPAGREGVIKRWDTATGKELPPLKVPLPSGPVFPSPDGRTLFAAAHDPTGYPMYSLLLLDAGSGRLLRQMDATGKGLFVTPPHICTVSADGRTWAVSTDGPTVVLFDTATGQKRGLLEPKHRIRALALSPDGRFLATGGNELRLWDLATGRIAGQSNVPQGLDVTSLAFSPDGKRLVVAGCDSAGLIYDMTELLREKRPAPGKLSAADLEGLWKDISGSDAVRAYHTIHRLAAASEGVALLKEHLKPLPASEQKRLAGLLVELNDDDFNVREKATRELEEMGRQAEPALRKVLDGKPSPEVRTRVEGLLKKLNPGGGTNPAEDVIGLRALEALEMAGTAEARQVIKDLAGGPADAPLTEAAKAALERLAARAGSAP